MEGGNLDLLRWFSEDERSLCPACGQRTCVTISGARGAFCLGCYAVFVDGERIDCDGTISPG